MLERLPWRLPAVRAAAADVVAALRALRIARLPAGETAEWAENSAAVAALALLGAAPEAAAVVAAAGGLELLAEQSAAVARRVDRSSQLPGEANHTFGTVAEVFHSAATASPEAARALVASGAERALAARVAVDLRQRGGWTGDAWEESGLPTAAAALAACAAWAETGEAGGAAADARLRRVAPRVLRGRRVQQRALAAAAEECDALAAELGAKEAEAAAALELDAAPVRLAAAVGAAGEAAA